MSNRTLILRPVEKVSIDTKLKDIAIADVSVMAIMSRFGVKPGYGLESVGELCQRTGIDSNLFLLIINEYRGINESDRSCFPEVGPTIEFIRSTDTFYEKVQLPNIMRHLRPIGDARDVIERYIRNLSRRFESRRENDENKIFPKLLSGGYDNLDRDVISLALEYDRDLVSELEDLLEFFIIHFESGMDPNMLLGVITAIDSMRKDVEKTNSLRKKLLYDLSEDSTKSKDVSETDQDLTQLTQREKEVLILLAEGLSSKEIAERLCISANTAITHRRNISSKLGIRSVAGLLRYAYTHHLLTWPDNG